ncbi:MAG: non-canonical purine NTP pyrophosphatase, partial [Candidatus Omnitrophica bacterium]|nr:non-canonical purine NTP pyrophosphatase [Candidatus Omnitrophota bacterium]
YDPLFLPDGFEVTTAEMTPEQKHEISHRGKALRKVKEFLESLEPHE